MKDALDNNIAIGNKYGASYVNAGRTVIVTGTAVKVGKAKTTIEVDSVRQLGKNKNSYCAVKVGSKHPIFHE